jgi:hypothetical protein
VSSSWGSALPLLCEIDGPGDRFRLRAFLNLCCGLLGRDCRYLLNSGIKEGPRLAFDVQFLFKDGARHFFEGGLGGS